MTNSCLPQSRNALGAITAYTARPSAAIDLSDNTNRWGTPPAALREIRAVVGSRLASYPDAYGSALKVALAEYTGVRPEMIATGCGSDDVLDATIRAFGDPGTTLAFMDPSFVMIPVFGTLSGLTVARVPLGDGYALDAETMTSANPAIIYLCSPNNPTGTLLPRLTIQAIVAQSRGVVIVDEAYAEFSGESVIDLIAASPRLIVVRTMSKAFGLAGLRVGYAVGDAGVIAAIEKARGPFKVNALAERAAVAVLSEDVPWVVKHVAEAIAARNALERELNARGIAVAPSATNFVFAPIAGAARIADEMRLAGVAVRAFEGLPECTLALTASHGAALRITVGPLDEMDAALAALDRARIACA